MGRREFSIMGAVLEDSLPQYAAIYVPATNELFEAEKGRGAFLNNRPIRVRMPASLSEAVISCNRSNYPDDTSLEFGLQIIRLLRKRARSWRNIGTAGCEYTDVACEDSMELLLLLQKQYTLQDILLWKRQEHE